MARKDFDWNSIEGRASIYTNEIEYKKGKTFLKSSIGISTKDKDDNYHTFYLDCKFVKKAEEPRKPGKHIINIKNAFLSCEYWEKDKKEVTKPILVITDCELEE
jgi:hypothetical protein